MDIKKYSWTFDKREDIWTSDTFDTVMECVENAKKHIDTDEHGKKYSSIFVGENILFEPYVDACEVLELIECNAEDQCGEVAKDWYSYDGARMKTELAELSCKITAVVKEWLKKNSREPFFYSIRNIREVSLDENFEEKSQAVGKKPVVCETCDREEHCELHKECCDEKGESCDNHIPKGSGALQFNDAAKCN